MAAVRACACVCLLFILGVCGSSDAQSAGEPTSVGAGIARQDGNTELSRLTAPLASVEKEEPSVGDICKQVNGSIWTCQNIRDCPKAQEELKQGRLPPTCTAGNDPMVCCEPAGAKAKAMCKQYGEAVYSGNIVKVDNCAAAEPLVINDARGRDGKHAEPREYPHMALIGDGNYSYEWACSGSLISERFVLTTANCFDYDQWGYTRNWVRFGDYNINSTQDDETGMARSSEYEIIEIIKHPQYNSIYPDENDIALCKLRTEVKFNQFIRPICLQTEHQFGGEYAIATSWIDNTGNFSDILWKRNVTIISRQECSHAYSYGGLYPNSIIRYDSQLCASATTCKRRSGQPLQLRLKEPYCMYSLVGVSSFSSERCPNVPEGYTSISHFVPWIESIVWP